MAQPQQQPDKEKPEERKDYRQLMDSFLSHNMGSTIMGGPLGGIASYIWPQQSSQLNHAVANHTLLPAVGRVMTNLTTPFGYVDKFQELVDTVKRSPLDSAKAVWNDRPPYENVTGLVSRELPSRALWNLPPRDWGQKYTKNPDGTYGVDAATEREQQATLKPRTSMAKDGEGINFGTGLLGNTTYTPTTPTVDELRDNKVAYTFRDPWDVGLNKGERVDNAVKALRYGVDKLTSPNATVFSGRVAVPAPHNSYRPGVYSQPPG